MARNSSQSAFRERNRTLVKQAAMVSFGVDLPDLYCDLVLSNKIRFRDAVKVYQQRLSEYHLEVKELH